MDNTQRVQINFLLVVLYHFLFPITTSAQFGPPRVTLETVGFGITELVTADLDGDGDMDLISGTDRPEYHTKRLAWYKNENGNYGSQIIISDQIAPPRRIIPVDLDQDGDIDLVVFGEYENPNELAWFENRNGLGDFGPKKLIGTFNLNLTDLDIFDFNSDGNLEFITGFLDGAITVSTFFWEEERLEVAQTFESQSLQSGILIDLDEDDDLDFLGKLANGETHWYENEDGLGNFSAGNLITVNQPPQNLLTAGDMDNDGDMDIVSISDKKMWWHQNIDGPEQFAPGVLISEENQDIEGFKLADMDEDGDLDIFYIAQDEVIRFENVDGLGSFAFRQVINDDILYLSSMVTVDVDLDGDTDLLTASYYNLSIHINQNNSANFIRQDLKPDYINQIDGVYLHDVDNDSQLDILLAKNNSTNTDYQPLWQRNLDGQGNFGPALPMELNTGSNISQLADFDGDGIIDILTTSTVTFNHRQITWYKKADNSTLQIPKMVVDSTGSFHSITVADIDQDGDQDILTGEGDIIWYENTDGQGNFAAPALLLEHPQAAFVLLTADLNGDQDLDLIVGDDGSGIFFYENMSGTFNYQDQKIVTLDWLPGFGPFIIQAIDIDGDNDLDVGYANILEGGIRWVENLDGAGNFSTAINETYNHYSYSSFLFHDMDEDGDTDILAGTIEPATNDPFSNLSWGENTDGLGNYTRREINLNAGFEYASNSFAVGDLDHDGDDDVVSVSRDYGMVYWNENLNEQIKIQGTIFLDENENGLLDTGERGLKNQGVEVSPNELFKLTTDHGQYRLALDTGEYLITLANTPLWIPTSSDSIEISITENSTLTDYNFGLKPSIDRAQINVDLSSAPTRCGFTVPFWLSLSNTGTQVLNGHVTVKLDPLVTLVTSFPEPIEITDSTLTWNFSNIYPTYDQTIRFQLQMPGVENIGEEITLISEAQLVDDNGNPFYQDDDIFISEINCAYDPNDKIVSPDFPGNDNYTLMSDSLQYTIRFQNTGTDTAFTVVLEDYLDENLDWETFRPISSSHPFETQLFQNGLLKFTFKDIMLPDSNINEIASHGFVKYEIFPKSGLAENTFIQNRAAIFFDFNPPIRTNTTGNILLETFDRDGDGFAFFEECDDFNDEVYPTATEIPNNGIDENCDGLDLIVSNHDQNTFPLKISPNPTNGRLRIELPAGQQATVIISSVNGQILLTDAIQANDLIDLSGLPAGLYLLVIQSHETRWIRRVVKM